MSYNVWTWSYALKTIVSRPLDATPPRTQARSGMSDRMCSMMGFLLAMCLLHGCGSSGAEGNTQPKALRAGPIKTAKPDVAKTAPVVPQDSKARAAQLRARPRTKTNATGLTHYAVEVRDQSAWLKRVGGPLAGLVNLRPRLVARYRGLDTKQEAFTCAAKPVHQATGR